MIALVCVSLGLIFIFAVYAWVSKQRFKSATAAELDRQYQAILEQQNEILFLKDWRVDAKDLKIEQQIAVGGQGVVYRGVMQGHFGHVAIKKLITPWNTG